MIDYHTRLDSQSAVLYYKGPFDKDILANISLQLRLRFTENPRMSAKLFSVFIELAQNISYYSAESNFFYDQDTKKDIKNLQQEKKNNGVGTVVIHNNETEVILSAGNLVPTAKVKEIITKCEEINRLSTEQLRALKKEVRSLERNKAHKGGNIGLIQVALKSEHPLQVESKKIDEENSYFIISSTIEK
ncbi:SiaB family protein kinase [Bernardetia sp. ABR2-2B]|uniref:SiaB family protein kinase n=1 Tax=Bernardetia sp. ABR2-2B TaxID=3127472 RepID=UPI0030CD5C86